MPESKRFLEKVHINNFLSFGDVELPLKPLIVLVGPNASGNSNVLEVLHLLYWLIEYGQLPPISFVRDRFPTGIAMRSTFRFEAKVDQTRALYDLALEAKTSDSTVARDLQPSDQKSHEGDPTAWQKEWNSVVAYFHDAFANTPEDEVARDLDETLAEVRRERT